MNKLTLILGLLFLLLYTKVSVSDTELQSNQVIVSSSIDWKPFAFIDKSNELKGTDVELLRKILKPLNIHLDHINGIPAKRLSSSNEKLGFNTVLAATYNEQRAQSHYFSIPYRKERIGVFVMSPTLVQYKSMEQLLRAGYLGALNKSGFYGDNFERLKKTMSERFVHIGFSDRRIEMLRAGRVDFILNDIDHNPYAVIKTNAENLVLSFVLIEQNVSFMFVKSAFREDFIHKFNTSLKEVLNTSKHKTNE